MRVRVPPGAPDSPMHVPGFVIRPAAGMAGAVHSSAGPATGRQFFMVPSVSSWCRHREVAPPGIGRIARVAVHVGGPHLAGVGRSGGPQLAPGAKVAA